MNQVESTLGENKGAIQCISSQKGKFISNLFLVGKKDGGHRPVINLKSLNNFLSYHHFKTEDLNAVKYLLQRNDYMCKIDLKDAYFCIPLHRSSQRFIHFLWKGSLYELCLRFRLRLAQSHGFSAAIYRIYNV